jgi:ABC-type multidrug transport system fused ATPase/permease subunit
VNFLLFCCHQVQTEAPYDKEHAAQQAIEKGAPATVLLEPPASWPERGRIEFRDVCARYRPELERVLSRISFTVESQQKVPAAHILTVCQPSLRPRSGPPVLP